MLAILHVAVAVYAQLALGFVVPLGWDNPMAALSTAALRDDPLRNIWWIHTQPPLYNLWGAAMIKLFYPHFLGDIYTAQIVMGGAICALAYGIARHLIRNSAVAFVIVALYTALDPALLLLETLTFYTVITTLIVVAGVFCLSLFADRRHARYLVAFVACFSAAVLTRTLYHLIFLVPVVILAVVLVGAQWRRMLVISCIICLAPVGWHAKNAVQYGFFGATSWAGMNLWHIVQQNYSDAQLQTLANEGYIDPVVAALPAFSHPDAYAEYGFDARSSHAILNEDNYQNINMVPVGKLYLQSALRVIAHDPLHYARNVLRAYRLFARPSSFIKPGQLYVYPNQLRIPDLMQANANVLYGRAVSRLLSTWGGLQFSPMLGLLLPVCWVGYAGLLLKKSRGSRMKFVALIREDPVTFFVAILIAYTTLVACMGEFGENNRFKMPIEPVMWPFIAGMLYRGVAVGVSYGMRRFRGKTAAFATEQ